MNTAIEELRQKYLVNYYKSRPHIPESIRYAPKFSDKTANGLQKCIINYLILSGWQAERISPEGRYRDTRKVVKNCIGQTQTIGNIHRIKSAMQPGTADISVIIKGQSVKIEVKTGKDKQSEKQKIYQSQVEQAGGQYWLIHDFTEFLEKYNQFIH